MTAPGTVDYFVIDVETANQSRTASARSALRFLPAAKWWIAGKAWSTRSTISIRSTSLSTASAPGRLRALPRGAKFSPKSDPCYRERPRPAILISIAPHSPAPACGPEFPPFPTPSGSILAGWLVALGLTCPTTNCLRWPAASESSIEPTTHSKTQESPEKFWPWH